MADTEGQFVVMRIKDLSEVPTIYPNFSDRQVSANSVDPDQTPQNVAFEQNPHCLPFI